MNEELILERLIKRLKQLLPNNEALSIITNFEIIINTRRINPDILISKEGELFALIEIKQSIIAQTVQEFYNSFKIDYPYVPYLIISDGEKCNILDTRSDRIVESPIEDIFKILLIHIPKEKLETFKDKISEEINMIAESIFYERPQIKKHLRLKDIRKNILYNENGKFFHFSEDILDLENFEHTLFKLFLEEIKPGERIHRYTTLETVFSTIYYSSIRLNGIVGMNDISEIGYVENYLDKNYSPFWSDNTHHRTISAINRRFISCSSILEDDLNQWRLYGDDGKGACLTFKVKKKHGIPGIQIRKISYGRKVDGKNYHIELDFIKQVIENVKTKFKQTITFRTLDIWKHFFKSFEYEPEQEVRLLVIASNGDNIKGEHLTNKTPHSLKKEWGLTATHKILNPYITINLEDTDLPIRLEKIWLGLKCPEKYVNKKQFEELLRFKKIKNVQVSPSSINSYR
jgi:hypothetical protein